MRQEIRHGSSTALPIRFWPKVSGLNIISDAGPTFSVYRSDGTQIGASTAATLDSVGGVSRFTASITWSTFGQTLMPLGESYRVDFTWTHSGATYVEAVQFDVVVEPWSTLNTSGNDLIDEWSGIAGVLERQAEVQADGRTAEQQAQVLLIHATREIRSRIKRRVETEGKPWPIYIVNRDEVRPVVVAEAVRRAVVAQGLTSDVVITMAEFWRGEVERRLAAMPDLRYSADENRTEDGSLSVYTTARTSRSW